MFPQLKSTKLGKPAKLVLTSIPGPLAQNIEKLAVVKECTFSEMLAHLVEEGLRLFEQKPNELPASAALDDLSPRQRAVLENLRKGLAVKEIADKLSVSEVTVRTHIHRIRERRGSSDILELRIPGE